MRATCKEAGWEMVRNTKALGVYGRASKSLVMLGV